MDSWFVRDRKEAWKKKCMEKLGRDHFFPKDIWESIDDMNSVDRNEHIKQYYNVYVYRVLPYPPHTKDVKDFFVQRN